MGKISVSTDFERHNRGSRSIISFIEDGQRQEVFFDFQGEHIPLEKPSPEYALVAILPHAMRRNADIEILEPVRESMVAQLEYLIDIWHSWIPLKYKKISIRANYSEPQAPNFGKSAVLAMSGGVDALYSLHCHKRGLLGPRNLDIKCGVLVHGFDVPLSNDLWFANLKADVERIGEHYNTPLATVKTNLRDVLHYGDWLLNCIFGVSAVLLQFENVCANAAFSCDGYPYWLLKRATSRPLLASNVSDYYYPIHITQYGISRLDKVKVIASESDVLKYLRVCRFDSQNNANCGKCEKCLRTKLEFLAAGVDLPNLGPRPSKKALFSFNIKNNLSLSWYQELLEDENFRRERDLYNMVKWFVRRERMKNIYRIPRSEKRKKKHLLRNNS